MRKEELNKLKQEYESLVSKCKDLSDDELNEVTGGEAYFIRIKQGDSSIITGQFSKSELVQEDNNDSKFVKIIEEGFK